MSIVAVFTNGSITWIGSDTASLCTSGRLIETGSKWSKDHGWAFGLVGDARAADLVERNKEGLFGNLESPHDFVERLDALYAGANMKRLYREGETVPSWVNAGLLACAGAAWDIDSTLAISPVPTGRVWCRGTAGALGMAAAWGHQQAAPNASAEVLLSIALKGAAAFDVTIRGHWGWRLSPAGHETARQHAAEPQAM